ncbi:MAG: WbqC family protein [Clostridium sp.]|nr:WbqC family protein [Clostridium sp.]
MDYYIRMARCNRVWLDTSAPYDKRERGYNRTEIADTRGRLELTVPLARHGADGHRPRLWRDVVVSRHDEWWNIHRVTWESAYGRTPFFEFCFYDDFLPLLGEPPADNPPRIVDIDLALDRLIRKILLIDAEVTTELPAGARWTDSSEVAVESPGPYWQVRQDRFGFIPGLSVADLIFNLGPEAARYIRGARPE